MRYLSLLHQQAVGLLTVALVIYSSEDVQAADSGAVFSCLVSNSTGTTLSSNAILTVVLTPANDLCSGAFPITNYFYANTQSLAYATSQGDGAPGCTMSGFGNGVWYEFIPPTDGGMVVDTFGSSFKTAFATYAGSCGSLTEVRAAWAASNRL